MAQVRQKLPAKYDHLSEASIRCRVARRHDWKPVTAERVVGAFQTREECSLCKSERYSIIGNKGEIRSRHIAYSDFYLNKGERLDMEDLNALRLIVLHWDFKL